MTSHADAKKNAPPAAETPDMRERGGLIDGKPQMLDKRLFMQLLAFGGCANPAAPAEALRKSGIEGVLYADINDPRGIALLTFSEDETHFATAVRALLNEKPFGDYALKPEYSMFGRTYTIGYEPKLEDHLIHRSRRVALDPETEWAVWYPLRRKGEFNKLPREEQRPILGEHGTIGKAYGLAGLASDIRLACHGMDKNDNDFVIGLHGKRLAPLSKLVERMRKTVQTSSYMEKMGPFFTGRIVWRSNADA
jgi:chlorite dismutase